MAQVKKGPLSPSGLFSVPADDPVVRTIKTADLREVMASAVEDFRAMPTHTVFMGILYAVLGAGIIRFAFGYALLPLIFPLVAGFALLGPFAALGLYELSRRREEGKTVTFWDVVHVFRAPGRWSILGLGLILFVVFGLWLQVAMAIFGATMGGEPASVADFVSRLFGTPGGWALIVFGNAVGGLFALAVFMVSVVAFPLLLERNVGLVTAVLTSIRAVLANPKPMALWGLIVVAGLALGCLPFFVGLAVTLPLLGHGTWHLYRKAVERP